LEASLTCAKKHGDITIAEYNKAKVFLNMYCESAVLSMERGELEGNVHLQGYVEIRATSVQYVNRMLRAYMGWNSGYNIMLRPLRHDGLHTRIGLIGYCLKDKGKPWFRSWTLNVTEQEMKDGELQHMMLGAALKNRVALTYRNLLEKAHLYYQYHEHVRADGIQELLLSMIRSGKYYPSMEFIKPLPGHGFDMGRLNACWEMLISPSTTTQQQLNYVFFDVNGGMRTRV
jgi:hypothetical protein